MKKRKVVDTDWENDWLYIASEDNDFYINISTSIYIMAKELRPYITALNDVRVAGVLKWLKEK